MKKIILAGFGYLGKFIEQQADFNEKKVLYKLSRNPGKHRNGYGNHVEVCLLYTSPSPRDISGSRMPSSA